MLKDLIIHLQIHVLTVLSVDDLMQIIEEKRNW